VTPEAELVERIHAGDTQAEGELYQIYRRGMTCIVSRSLSGSPEDVPDVVQTIFLEVFKSLRKLGMEDPARLAGLVRTIAHREIASYFANKTAAGIACSTDDPDHQGRPRGIHVVDARPNPEETAIATERRRLFVEILAQMDADDREVLTRFYVHDQSKEQICEEMNLSETQFRLLKWRAKERLTEACRIATKKPIPKAA
jgi:RNA polymerase sigma-70 factor (ECF subfamily)